MPKCLFINACLRGEGISRTAQLFRHLLGVPQSLCIAADGLDLVGNHPDEILQHTLEQIDQLPL